MTVHVLDLFSGTGSFSRAFEESDAFTVHTVNLEPVEFLGETVEPDLEADIRDLDAEALIEEFLPDGHEFDVVLASPPCTTFSMASVGHHLIKDEDRYYPDSPECGQNIELVQHTLDIIEDLEPRYWFMENPRAMLRKVLDQPEHYGTRMLTGDVSWTRIDPEAWVSWCQYWSFRDMNERGGPVMKPTDLWGEHPETFEYRQCRNGDGSRPTEVMPEGCHESAPRGSSTGTQGRTTSDVRGAIPWGLSKTIMESVEIGIMEEYIQEVEE